MIPFSVSGYRQTQKLTAVMLFSLLVVLLICESGYLISSHRILKWDGLNRYFQQYFFLNGVMTAGEIPLWLPYDMHGLPSNANYIVQGSILQNTLLLLGPLIPGLKAANGLAVFYATIFVDEMLLLIGVWLWTSRFMVTVSARFFTSMSVMGSCIWMDQPFFNFHFYYAIPLLLHLFHRLMDTGRWWYGMVAVNLLAIQLLGSALYLLPVILLTLTAYCLTYAALYHHECFVSLKSLCRPIRDRFVRRGLSVHDHRI